MIILVAQYLLAGVILALGLETVIRWTGQDVDHVERIMMIVAWPVMVFVFVYNFIKGLLG